MHVLVTGATGFIGSALVPSLIDSGHQVTIVSRHPARALRQFGAAAAACALHELPQSFDAVINLAGATINRRWTRSAKQEIRDSRVDHTARIRKAAEERGARTFISASAIGYYGDRGEEELTEASPPGNDFLARLGMEWEAAAHSEKMRVAIVRTAVVLHRDGGALRKMLPPFRLGLGGRLGSGRQWWSWIHRDDIVAIYRWALENPEVSGPLNGASPQPKTNADFTKALARAVHRPTIFPVPRFALKLMFGELADVLLYSQKVLPARTRKLGYQFKYAQLDDALSAALG